MNINEFISQYNNHPVLFVGTDISLRYLNNSYTWDGLLKKIALELTGDIEFYLEIKSKCQVHQKYKFNEIAALLEKEFNSKLSSDRNGKFEKINDIFFENMKNGINICRVKIYISELLSALEYKPEMQEELNEFKKIRKNISSVITTNYDNLIEKTFDFLPLIGNNIYNGLKI